MMAYLSGAIEHACHEGKAWREEMTQWLKERLNHDAFNPVIVEESVLSPEELQVFRTWRDMEYPRFKEAVRKLIDRDLERIVNDADYLICYWDKGVLHGGGTHGEVTMAYHCGIPVYIVLGMPKREVSAWILGCSSEEFVSFEALKEFLEAKYAR